MKLHSQVNSHSVRLATIDSLVILVMTRYIGTIKKLKREKNTRNKPNKPSAEGVSELRSAEGTERPQNRKKSCEELCESLTFH